MMAVSDALPGHLGVPPEQVEPLLEGLTDKAEALARHLNPRTGPQGLDARYYRADGESVFVKPHAARFATDNQLLGEAEVRAAAARRGAPTWTTEAVDEVVARFARGGRPLGADQEAALRGILTSGAAVEVLNAPAGTGKSFLVGALADTWPLTGAARPARPAGRRQPADPAPSPTGAGPRVFGVAYGQRQADVLAEEGVDRAEHPPLARRAGPPRRRPRHAATTRRSGCAAGTCWSSTRPAPPRPRTWSRSTAAASRRGRSCCWSATPGSWPRSAPAARWPTSPSAGSPTTWPRSAASPRRGRARRRCGCATATPPWSTSTPSTAGSSTPAPSSRPNSRPRRVWLADTLAGRDALLVVGTNAAAARVSNQLRAELVRLGRVPRNAASRSACPAGRAPSPGSGTSCRPAATPGTSTAGPATPRPRSTARPTGSPPPTPTAA